MTWTPQCLSDLLMRRAAEQPDGLCYVLGDEAGSRKLTYAALDTAARAVAAQLQHAGIGPGQRALLLYPPGGDYLAGLFGCLYAGVIAVPLYPPTGKRGAERIIAVAGDAGASAVMTDEATGAVAAPGAIGGAAAARWLVTSAAAAGDGAPAADWRPVRPATDSVALLQYTSGSTARPKGVLLTHGNLLHNSAVIADVLAADETSRGVCWLPPYHDMGLIGGILQPLYSGFPCMLMSPLSFIYSPARWLRAISSFRATDSAAPDFAYAECVSRITDAELAGLDLSCWRNAMVGAEPVRAKTLSDFAARFGRAGFSPAALRPCYGLAEATLFVTGSAARVPAAALTLDRAALTRGTAIGARHGVTVAGCGRPQGPDLVRIVDIQTRREQPPDAVGEIWVSGPTVGAGYWGLASLSQRTFGARLAGDGGRRWLRTGDLGFTRDGEVFVTGRLKDLIVVRGANHYPTDIEATAVQASGALAAGRAAAFSVDDGQAERVVLVGELARGPRRNELDEIAGSVRSAIAREHQLDLADVVLVRRGAVPRTSSGKVRRAACRDAYLAGTLSRLNQAAAKAAVQSEAADDVTALVAEVLGRAPAEFRGDAALAGQGLDSLRAARLQAALRFRYDVEVDLEWLLSEASPASLAERVRTASPVAGQAAGKRPVLPVTEAGRTALASSAQQRLWLLDQLGAGAAYNVAGLIRWRSAPDAGVLRDALRLLAERHEALRAWFRLAANGDLEQVISPALTIDVPVHEVRDQAALTAWCGQAGGLAFDLSEPPLWRAALLHVVNRGEWVLLVVIHHIVADGWSLGLLASELDVAYSALACGGTPRLPALRSRYADFAAWQRAALSSGAFAAHADYWRRTLDGLEPLTLAAGSASGALSFAGGRVPIELGADLVGQLREFAGARQATLFMAIAAGWSVLLSRWTDRTDVTWATAVAGRRWAELDGVVGFFANTLPVRVKLGGDLSFDELLSRLRSACLGAYEHQDLPFDEIVRQARSGSSVSDSAPLVRHFLAMNDTSQVAAGLRAGQLEVCDADTGTAKFDVGIELTAAPDGSLTGVVEFAASVLSAAAAARLAAGMAEVLRAGVADPSCQAALLPVMPSGELALVTSELAVAKGERHKPPPDLVGWLETAADRWADRVAVTVDGSGESLSYAELDRRANQLGRLLRARGAGVESTVGVCLERSADLVSAVLAVWKAGAVYVPLDPGYPPGRLRDMVAQAKPVLLLTTSALRRWLALDLPAVCLDEAGVADEVVAQLPARLGRMTRPDNAAYAVFTSGSTGNPKGAVNTYRGLLNRMSALQQRLGLAPTDVVAVKTPIGFDVGVSEMLWPLLCGARLVLAVPGGHRDPAYLHELFNRYRVSTADFVPSVLRAFLDAGHPAGRHPHLRRIICIGEELSSMLVSDFGRQYPGVELHNRYGPAEAAIDVTEYQAGPIVPPRVPIGEPIAGARLYVLDHWLQPVPAGVAAELFIAGVQVGRGYLNRPGLTADRFVPDPFGHGARMYATGDRARWNDSGLLEFLGRVDFQVKVRGHRVEPGEVQARLRACAGVADAVVTAKPDGRGQQRLIAYLVPAGDRPADGELREALSENLPDAMIPSRFIWLAALPLSNNGKIDLRALPEAGAADHRARGALVPPRDAIERRIAAIWAELLEVDQVGIHDSFFDLGGHSLLATRVISRIRAELGVELSLADVFTDQPTVAKLSEQVREAQLSHATAADLRTLLAAVAELSDEEVAQRLAADPFEHSG